MKTNSAEEVIIMVDGIEQKEHITLTDDGVEHQVHVEIYAQQEMPAAIESLII